MIIFKRDTSTRGGIQEVLTYDLLGIGTPNQAKRVLETGFIYVWDDLLGWQAAPNITDRDFYRGSHGKTFGIFTFNPQVITTP